jgi:outer membrane biosynthesis protein TonB
MHFPTLALWLTLFSSHYRGVSTRTISVAAVESLPSLAGREMAVENPKRGGVVILPERAEIAPVPAPVPKPPPAPAPAPHEPGPVPEPANPEPGSPPKPVSPEPAPAPGPKVPAPIQKPGTEQPGEEGQVKLGDFSKPIKLEDFINQEKANEPVDTDRTEFCKAAKRGEQKRSGAGMAFNKRVNTDGFTWEQWKQSKISFFLTRIAF